MSLKDKLDRAAELANDLLSQVTKSFPDAAGIVNSAEYDLQGKMARAKAAVLAGADELVNAIKPSIAPDVEGKPGDVVYLFRHVRDGYIAEDGERIILPSGGLSFYIKIDHPKKELSVSTCVQVHGKNFQYRLGRNVSQGRFEHGQYIVANYDMTKSLVQNLQYVLDSTVSVCKAIPDAKKNLSEAKIDFMMIQQAANMLREFTKSLPRELPGDPK